MSRGGLSDPRGLAFGPDGNLYVVSNFNNEVLRYNGTTGAFIDAFLTIGSGSLNSPRDLTPHSPDEVAILSTLKTVFD